jgi:hypothetical protein
MKRFFVALALSASFLAAGCSLFLSQKPPVQLLDATNLTAACDAGKGNQNACALNQFMVAWCDGQIVLPANLPGFSTLVCTELGYPLAPKMAAAVKY